MGRHTRNEPPDDEPVPGASRGPYYGAPADPSYDIFSGPTDDRVFVSSYERPRSGPPPAAERQHGPPGGGYRFDPLPGDYPGDYPGAPASAPESPRDRPKPRPEPSDGRSWTKFISMLPLRCCRSSRSSSPSASSPTR